MKSQQTKICVAVCTCILMACAAGGGSDSLTGPKLSSSFGSSGGLFSSSSSSSISASSTGGATSYGATADQGETDDPLVDGVTYTGDVYYIDCTGGNDANAGTSPAAAWQTLEQVRTKIMAGYWDTVPANANTSPPFHAPWTSAPSGSAFLFKRGCTFDGYLHIQPYVLNPLGGSGWYNDNITFGAYGSRIAARPEISYITPKAENSSGNVVASNGLSAHFKNLTLSDGGIGTTVMFLNYSKNFSIENCTIKNGANDGITADYTENLLIKNSIIQNNQTGGGRGGGLAAGGKNLQILNNSFLNNGRDQIGAHNAYLREMDHATIKGNYFSGGSNMGLVIHGTNNNLVITQNEVTGNSNGLSVSSGYYAGEVEVADQVEITENIIHDNGYRAGEQGYCMIHSAITNAIIANNICYNNRLGGMTLYDGPAKDIPSSNVQIFNNVFNEILWYALDIDGSNLDGINVRNNIFVNTAVNKPSLRVETGVPLAKLTINNNLYYTPNYAGGQIVSVFNTDITLSTFQNSYGFETSGYVGNPLFVNAAGGDYHLQNTSPAKHAGINTGAVTYDFDGTIRNVTTPSIGAFE